MHGDRVVLNCVDGWVVELICVPSSKGTLRDFAGRLCVYVDRQTRDDLNLHIDAPLPFTPGHRPTSVVHTLAPRRRRDEAWALRLL